MAKGIKMTVTKKSPSEVMAELNKTYGAGTIVSSNTTKQHVDVISTGSFGLDLATGIGGLPRGKVVEFMGWESSGKSTITLQTIANAQKMGITCALIDGEHSFDSTYAKSLGINTDDLLINQPDYGEQGYDVAEKLMDSGVGLIIIDSQTALLPKKVIDADAGDTAMGLHARLMSQVVPKLMHKAGQNNCLIIFISQFREKIGVMFGSPETTNGGHALKFYSHMRVEIRKSIDKEESRNKTRIKIIKNKLANPFGTAEFYINWGTGVDRFQEILDHAVELEIIQKAGSWFSYGETKIGQGFDSVKQLLQDNPELYKEIENKVLNSLNIALTLPQQNQQEDEKQQEYD